MILERTLNYFGVHKVCTLNEIFEFFRFLKSYPQSYPQVIHRGDLFSKVFWCFVTVPSVATEFSVRFWGL